MHHFEHVGDISFRLPFGEEQIEFIIEAAIFPRLDILPISLDYY